MWLDNHNEERKRIEDFNQSTPELAALSNKAQNGDHAAGYQLFQLQRKAGLWKGNDPLQDDARRESMVAKLQATVPGKAYLQALAVATSIETDANDPNILSNNAMQLNLVDGYLREITGSTRPGIAQYQSILGYQSGTDMWNLTLNHYFNHPILGPNQIKSIAEAAKKHAEATENAYHSFLYRNATLRGIAQEVGELPEDYVVVKTPT